MKKKEILGKGGLILFCFVFGSWKEGGHWDRIHGVEIEGWGRYERKD